MELQYKRLTLADLSEIEALQQLVVENLQDKTILQPLSNGEFTNILTDHGLMLGAFDAEKLVACRALLKPAVDEEEHLGVDALAKDLSRVIYQEVSFVHPQYRGLSLQRKLGTRIMNEIDLTRFDIVCATVKPYNIASLKDKFSQGLQVIALKHKYGGKLRYVFAKQLHTKLQFKQPTKLIEMSETERQQKLLSDGYIGTGLINKEDKWYIAYQKKN